MARERGAAQLWGLLVRSNWPGELRNAPAPLARRGGRAPADPSPLSSDPFIHKPVSDSGMRCSMSSLRTCVGQERRYSRNSVLRWLVLVGALIAFSSAAACAETPTITR